MKTDWIVRGDLDGDVNTSGSHFGGKQSMWLAARHLRLDRRL